MHHRHSFRHIIRTSYIVHVARITHCKHRWPSFSPALYLQRILFILISLIPNCVCVYEWYGCGCGSQGDTKISQQYFTLVFIRI